MKNKWLKKIKNFFIICILVAEVFLALIQWIVFFLIVGPVCIACFAGVVIIAVIVKFGMMVSSSFSSKEEMVSP